jgi:hypothetical protein
VARIEGIKNQLNLIKALNNTHFKLLLIGNIAPANQLLIMTNAVNIAAENIQFYRPYSAGRTGKILPASKSTYFTQLV